MKHILIAALLLTVLTGLPVNEARAESGVSKIEDCIDVVKAINEIPEKGIPPALLHNAAGVAIIPGVIKAGFILGGRYGTGVMMVREKDGAWSNPSFISLAGGSIGWQAGVESIDIVLVFKSPRGIERLMTGKFTLGADAGVSAGPVGREASAATDVQLQSEIYSYSRSRGLFAGLSLSGTSLQIDDESNEKFYGKRLSGRDIVREKDLAAPAVVERLRKQLQTY